MNDSLQLIALYHKHRFICATITTDNTSAITALFTNDNSTATFTSAFTAAINMLN